MWPRGFAPSSRPWGSGRARCWETRPQTAEISFFPTLSGAVYHPGRTLLSPPPLVLLAALPQSRPHGPLPSPAGDTSHTAFRPPPPPPASVASSGLDGDCRGPGSKRSCFMGARPGPKHTASLRRPLHTCRIWDARHLHVCGKPKGFQRDVRSGKGLGQPRPKGKPKKSEEDFSRHFV